MFVLVLLLMPGVLITPLCSRMSQPPVDHGQAALAALQAHLRATMPPAPPELYEVTPIQDSKASGELENKAAEAAATTPPAKAVSPSPVTAPSASGTASPKNPAMPPTAPPATPAPSPASTPPQQSQPSAPSGVAEAAWRICSVCGRSERDGPLMRCARCAGAIYCSGQREITTAFGSLPLLERDRTQGAGIANGRKRGRGAAHCLQSKPFIGLPCVADVLGGRAGPPLHSHSLGLYPESARLWKAPSDCVLHAQSLASIARFV